MPSQQQQILYSQIAQDYKVVGPVINTHNDRGSNPRTGSTKPSWWG